MSIMSQACCEDRFNQCSMLVMGMGGSNAVTSDDDRETVSAGVNEVGDQDQSEDDVNKVGVKDLRPKESRLNDADLQPFLSGFPDCKTFIGFSAFIFFQSAVFGAL